MSCSLDSILGACLGTAVGDALGMPIEGISHQNVRTYYKGIKEYRADEQRKDLDAGQWTDDTQMTFALIRALSGETDPEAWPKAVAAQYVALREEARRWGPTTTAAIDQLANGADPATSGTAEHPTNGAAMRAAPLGVWWACTGASREDAWRAIRPVLEITHRHPASVAAGFGQAFAIRWAVDARAMDAAPDAFDTDAFWSALIETVAFAETVLAEKTEAKEATAGEPETGEPETGEPSVDDRVSVRLRHLRDHLDDVPLDVRDASGGAGVRADEAWPYACAMFARRPHLLENSLLSSINVGADADTHGAMLGSLLGALHGWNAFPAEWRDGLEARAQLEEEATALGEQLAG